MKRMSIPSLQHMTMVKIAVELWNQDDLRASVLKLKIVLGHRQNWREWLEIEEKALDKVAQLPIPELLKKEFSRIISPIGLQIKNWWVYHRLEFSGLKLPNQFTWTPSGIIERKKIAQSLLKDEDLDVGIRYELACMYCLENEIPELWKQIDDNHKQNYYKIDLNCEEMDTSDLVIFWTLYIKGELSKLVDWQEREIGERSSPYLLAFKFAIFNRNEVAVEFFLGKLTKEEKVLLLETIAESIVLQYHDEIDDDVTPNEFYSNVFVFLVSLLSDGEREELFKMYPYEMLKCFLEWPWQPLYVELAERAIHSIPEVVLGSIIDNVADGWTDSTNRQLFHHFWQLSPLSYKRQAIEHVDFCTVMKLFEGKDEVIIRALFEYADAIEKEGLILCRRDRDISVRKSLKVKGWEPSEEAIVLFQNEFLKRKEEKDNVTND